MGASGQLPIRAPATTHLGTGRPGIDPVGYSQPARSAIRMASIRLRAPVLVIALDR
jgi:hypothetical protein